MSYSPQIPPQKSEELLPYLSDEFAKIAESYNDLQDGFLGIDYVEPLRVRPGMIKLFDGTEADPEGTGVQTLYFMNTSGDWKGLSVGADTSAQIQALSSDVATLTSDVANLLSYITNAIGETPYAPLTLQNSWVGTAVYRRFAQGVDLSFNINSGTITDGTVIGNLPAGFRPQFQMQFPIQINSIPTGGVPYVRVGTNGDLSIHAFAAGTLQCSCTMRIPL
jgi:hypothetical protein